MGVGFTKGSLLYLVFLRFKHLRFVHLRNLLQNSSQNVMTVYFPISVDFLQKNVSQFYLYNFIFS